MVVDTIGNFLTIIRNGTRVGKRIVSAPYSKMRNEIAAILKKEGFIKNFSISGIGTAKLLQIDLKYVDSESVIHEIKRMSTPGKRLYTQVHNVKPVIGGLGISIITTSKGVMTDKDAKKQQVGGEVICTIW
jgi:small subunit ribosomal protein S8